MRRQHIGLGRQQARQPVQRRHPVAQGIGLRLRRPHRHIGGDTRQDLIPRQEDPVRALPQADMLGAVARSDHHGPVVLADPHHLAFGQPAIAAGHGGHPLAEPAVVVAPARDLRLAPARRAIEDLAVRRGVARLFGHQHPRRHIFQPRHRQGRARPLAQPARQADVIWMHVGADHPSHRPPAQRPLQRRLPGRRRLARPQPRIDHGPAVPVGQGVGVHMIQLKRQGEPQPQHAPRHLHSLAGGRNRRPRIGQAPPILRGLRRAVGQVRLQ